MCETLGKIKEEHVSKKNNIRLEETVGQPLGGEEILKGGSEQGCMEADRGDL